MSKVPKLRSATIMALFYLLFGILGVFWRSMQLYSTIIAELFLKVGKIVTVDLTLVDGFFVACGFLCLLIVLGLLMYSKSGLLFAIFSSLSLIVILVAFLVISILAFSIGGGQIYLDKVNILYLNFLIWPIFLPLSIFNLICFFFILRNLKYVTFLGGGY